MRPSSGAESFACVAPPVFTGARNLSQIAAPEDGRTPALLNFEALRLGWEIDLPWVRTCYVSSHC